MSNPPNSTVVIDPNAAPVPTEPVVIAGYELQDRLGVGGYGEVWRAIGPGGLPKAVKILFGLMDGQRADAELKSLERMRDLRHPFLLSVERIEVFDSRLIVVTELADGCLQDRYEQCHAAGERGIPREELLQYLRDAADALDFMLEQHGLQHLDIKPENLLLQGKHVKVGDFGLTKDISDTQISLVGGFTPLYAPPEIFEGAPSPTSDQYSLAIVYQAMLTGTPPFAGRTAAQLTAQHLRSTPDLSSLQPVDRPVIARALSKNPAARFSSCRAFVDELTKRRNSRVRAKLDADSGPALTAARTQRVEAASLLAPGEYEAVETQPIACVDVPTEVTFRPTLFIGIGGLGGKILSDIRERFYARFHQRILPAFPMLYLDSDRQGVSSLKAKAGGAGLTESEMLPMPLRTSNDYRDDDSLDLRWLSRRWLFNIPRSGDVEGIRPLGRLAVVDHQKSIRQRIRESLAAAMDPESIRSTSESLSLTLDPSSPEIIIVGSISGGTCSGAIQDVGGIVREECERMNVEPYRIFGMLLHGTSGQRQVGDIQEANTISCLTELKHTYTPGLSDNQPFDSVTILHLGDGLNPADYNRGRTQVAEYLFSRAATGTRRVLDHWLNQSRQDEPATDHIRVLGVASTDASVYSMIRNEAQSICHGLLNKWRFSMLTAPDFSATHTLLKNLTLTQTTLSEQVMNILRGETGTRIEEWSTSVWQELIQATDASSAGCPEMLRRMGTAFEDVDDARVPAILRCAQQAVPQTAYVAAARIREHIFCLLDEPERANGATAHLHEVTGQLENALNWITQFLGEVDRNLERLNTEAATVGNDAAATQALCKQYSAVRYYQAIYQFFVRYVTDVLTAARSMDAEFDTLKSSIVQMLEQFSNGESKQHPQKLIEAFDTHVLSSDNFHLIDLLNARVNNEDCIDRLVADAHAFLLASSGKASPATDRGFPEDAETHFTNIGGGRRVLAVLPDSVNETEWKAKVETVFGDCVSIERSSGNELTVYSEIEGVEFSTLLNLFASKNPRLLDYAARVRTRVDVSM